MATCHSPKNYDSTDRATQVPYKTHYFSYADVAVFSGQDGVTDSNLEASIAIEQVEYPMARFAHKVRFVAVHLHKVNKAKASKNDPVGPNDVIYYVLRNASIFMKDTRQLTLHDVGDLECLYYAICGKVKEYLFDVNVRLANHFITPEDQYIAFKSGGLGMESVTVEAFKATLMRYETFLYSQEVLELMRDAFKAKHIRGHKSGFRPTFLDPRNMTCGMIFASLKEKHQIELQDEEFEHYLKSISPEAAAIHRENRYSTGIHLRPKRVSKTNSPSRVGSEDLLGRGYDVEEKSRGPHYLRYLDEYSVMSIDYPSTKDSEVKSGTRSLLEIGDDIASRSAVPDGGHLLPNIAGSFCAPNKVEDRMEISTSLQRKEELQNQSLTGGDSSYSFCQLSPPFLHLDGPQTTCTCGLDYLCAPLCANDPSQGCLCIENSPFCCATKGADIDDMTYPRKFEEKRSGSRTEQEHVTRSTEIEIFQQDSTEESPPATPSAIILRHIDHMGPESPAESFAVTRETHSGSTSMQTYDGKPDLTDVVARQLFGGSLSIFAVELPNGERVRDTEVEWHNQLRAAMAAHRSYFEPDPDWYFPPGATDGRLCLQSINEQHTLRKRILDMTVGNITGKKAMCKPSKPREGFRNSTLTTNPMADRSAHRKPSLMAHLFTSRLRDPRKAHSKTLRRTSTTGSTSKAARRSPY